MVRSLFLVLFIVALLTQWMGKSIITANYLINQQRITAEKCINKKRPSKKCNGKCHLFKQLREQEQKENGNGPVTLPEITKIKTEQPAVAHEFVIQLPTSRQTGETVFAELQVVATSQVVIDIFHPPC